ncbi:4,5-DOPA dioxygenase extradiol [Pedobacter yulinensis]|uniref:4,5-DOPA dioxygenase extradiol n=1 Tax=Pedobacter yulinensis TaxID=2126353 RepID=A0A2T3HRP5_9SPHI|nr:4,5-DOPA dioxygenase extradiol [Pedobacter yulinensis]PST85108.1 4,5-DOPA dioxygenase extradiol [Pedobacter yulinensis]
MASFNQFKQFVSSHPETVPVPALFIGHGSPMNGIETNIFSRTWAEQAALIPLPAAVLVISAHWYTRGTLITAMDLPPTIHDFGGFPQALFDVQYPAPGSPALAAEAAAMVRKTEVLMDHDWGLDHGAWTVVRHMYPDANIPVLQMSIDYTKPPAWHYELAAEIRALRKRGVLILGSGNMVHNLRMLNWSMIHGGGYDWAIEANETFKQLIADGDHRALIHYEQLCHAVRLAVPTPEHYLPLLYILGLQTGSEPATIFNEQALGGSLTMTSVRLGLAD